MAQLEDLARGSAVRGILPESIVTVVDVQWHGTSAVELIFKDQMRRPGHQILFRMMRMVKEKLVKFDARPLFPERRAYTVIGDACG